MNFLETINFDWIGILNFHERPFRAKLIPSKLWRDLDRYRNDSVGLANFCKKWRTKIEWKKKPSKAAMYDTYVAIGGEYDPETRQVIMQLHTLDFPEHKFTDDSWCKFKYRFVQTLMHEMIHFMQYDRRGDQWSNYVLPHKKIGHAKKDAERRYLSEFDEIQAYAHCVLMDFKTFKPNVPVEELISRARYKKDSKTLTYILKTFDYDYKNNAAIPKLMNQILKWDTKYNKATK